MIYPAKYMDGGGDKIALPIVARRAASGLKNRRRSLVACDRFFRDMNLFIYLNDAALALPCLVAVAAS
jgi:hypothetical protein